MMSEHSEPLGDSIPWLLDQWMKTFTGVLESMMEEHPAMTLASDAAGEIGANPLIIEQSFKDCPEPMLWIGLPETVHQDLGKRVLMAAGVETSDVEENRATALEIIEQSIGGLISALNSRLSRRIGREPSKQVASFPANVKSFPVVIAFGETTLDPGWIAFNPLLVSWMEATPAPAAAERAPQPATSFPEAAAPTRSFDMLLDVALPVSVSFGKTELAVKDVLKLTTGSIVELNRAVSEPVDIIVNNCIIAHGEVVVVEGNYGVRILNLVSRKERLRTGGAAVAESRARVGST